MTLRLVSLIGLFVFVFVAWALSENRWRISWRIVVWGLGLQLIIGVLLLKTPAHNAIFNAMNSAVDVLVKSTLEGAKFVFGSLPDDLRSAPSSPFKSCPSSFLSPRSPRSFIISGSFRSSSAHSPGACVAR
jgi:nucleoside permease NupC